MCESSPGLGAREISTETSTEAAYVRIRPHTSHTSAYVAYVRMRGHMVLTREPEREDASPPRRRRRREDTRKKLGVYEITSRLTGENY